MLYCAAAPAPVLRSAAARRKARRQGLGAEQFVRRQEAAHPRICWPSPCLSFGLLMVTERGEGGRGREKETYKHGGHVSWMLPCCLQWLPLAGTARCAPRVGVPRRAHAVPIPGRTPRHSAAPAAGGRWCQGGRPIAHSRVKRIEASIVSVRRIDHVRRMREGRQGRRVSSTSPTTTARPQKQLEALAWPGRAPRSGLLSRVTRGGGGGGQVPP